MGAGGSWFAMNEMGAVIVVLNGAFANHVRRPPYRKSRGLIVLEIIAQPKPIQFLKKINLNGIEPFTLVLFSGYDLWEFRWDGFRKYFSKKDGSRAYIWSSWTLYKKAAQEKRNTLFRDFVSNDVTLEKDRIIDFHLDDHGDSENGFVVDRKNGLKTLSVTQAILAHDHITMNHFDLSTTETKTVSLKVQSPLNTVYGP